MPTQSPRRKTERRLFYFSAFLIFSSLALMGQVSRSINKADSDQLGQFTDMFSEVYTDIKGRYVEDVDSKKLFEGAIQGMFMTLDPHSQYMEPDNYMQLEKDTEGNFSGIGIHIGMRDGVLTCIAPMPGSPAAKAGVKPWDRIIEIDAKKTEGITLIDAVKKLTGPSGTSVKIKVYREGETELLEFELVRRNIKVDSVNPAELEPGIGYVRISKFSDNTARDLRKAIEDFRDKGTKGLIVDLRFNTGGLLSEAVDVSSLFLARDKLVVSTKGRLKGQNREYKASGEMATDLPLIVMINRSSASASEIFAGAVKDHNRGIVLGIKGQRSYGKGSVQTIEELNHSFEKDENGNPRRAAIRLTTAKYYLPNGETIDKQGVTPDIAVEIPKGTESNLLRYGMIGDPASEPDEDDTESTKTKFSWKSYNGDKSTSHAAASEPAAKPPVTLDKDGKPADANPNSDKLDEDSIVGSALPDKDKDTTGPQPRRTIALDRTLFPDGEVEGAVKKPEPKKASPKDRLDYQLEVAKRLMRAKILEGKDFYDPAVAVPPDVKKVVDAAAKPDNQQAAAATNGAKPTAAR